MGDNDMNYTMPAKCCNESRCKNIQSNNTWVMISGENKSKVQKLGLKKYAQDG